MTDPVERLRSRPKRHYSHASPSDPRVEEASRKSESATGGGNGRRLAVATRATVFTA